MGWPFGRYRRGVPCCGHAGESACHGSGLKYLLSSTASTAVNLLPQQRALRLIGFCIVTEESIMQSRTKDGIKGKTKERLGKPMNDPTLEGKDENKVGRVQEKIGPVD